MLEFKLFDDEEEVTPAGDEGAEEGGAEKAPAADPAPAEEAPAADPAPAEEAPAEEGDTSKEA